MTETKAEARKESRRWAVDFYRRSFIESAHQVALRLQRAALDVERELWKGGRYGFEKRGEDGWRDSYYSEAEVARQILHEVLWAVPNMGLDSLQQEARRCETALALLETAERLDRGEEL